MYLQILKIILLHNLMRGVFRNHNKDEFEIFLYSSGGNDNTNYKETIKSYCDHFLLIPAGKQI